MFKDIIFWCEFPEEINWDRFNALLNNYSCSVYITAKNLNDFKKYKSKITAKNVRIGVWPILPLNEGYWFSGFSSRESISSLKQFQNIPMKIDIEPPFPDKNYSFFKTIFWLIKYLIKSSKNSRFLESTIKELSKNSKVIISGFPAPSFIRKLYGDPIKLNKCRNWIFYTSFFLNSRFYYKLFFQAHKDDYFAFGLTNHGIFGNEPEYKSIDNFKKDISFAKDLGIKNIIIYSIEGITKRNDADEWLRVLFN